MNLRDSVPPDVAKAIEAEAAQGNGRIQADPAELEPARAELAGLDIPDLLDRVLVFLRRFVVLPGEAEERALTLFIAHTHALEGAHATPYLLVISPEKRSGKTRLLEVIGLLVHQGWQLVNPTESVLFRKIAASRPTILLDEIDAVFGSNSDRTEPVRSLLNAGNRPGSTVSRTSEGKDREVIDHPVFCPKVLAGIDTGRLPDTIRDRSIPIRMQRKTSAEPVERFRARFVGEEADALREALASALSEHLDALEAAMPRVPVGLDDRSEEAWEPLFAIADLGGGEWPEQARAAALELSGEDDAETDSLGMLLLGAARDAFEDESVIGSEELQRYVNEQDELPFGGFGESGISKQRIAGILRPFIRPHHPEQMRLPDGANRKGYRREWFAEAWDRYLPPTPTEAKQSKQPKQGAETGAEKPHEQADVSNVSNVSVPAGSKGDVSLLDYSGGADE